MKITRLKNLFYLVCITATPAFACGPFFPNSYFSTSAEEEIFFMPEASFHHELTILLGAPAPTATASPAPSAESFVSYAYYISPAWANTLKIDMQDLSASLAASGKSAEDASRIRAEYQAMREAMYKYSVDRRESMVYASPADPTPAPFDMRPYQVHLAELPVEFKLYADGAAAFYNDDRTEAARLFERLLDLPAAKRKNKSLWATFMLGRCHIRTDATRAASYFEKTNELVGKGTPDPLGLSNETPGWMAYISENQGDRLAAMKKYAELFQTSAHHHNGHISLRWLCSRAFLNDELDIGLAKDPLVRRILTAWVIAHPDEFDNARKLLKAVASSSGDSKPMDGADRLAWAAYNAGDVNTAQKWIEYSPPDSLYGRWVQSKILLRKGETDKAIEMIRDLAKKFPESDAWELIEQTVKPRDETLAEIGVLTLSRREYVQSMDALLRGGYWRDAAYVAERVLTSAELLQYVEIHADDQELMGVLAENGSTNVVIALKYLLARRLGREGRWEKATPFYPQMVQDAALSFQSALAKTKNNSLAGSDRAVAFFDAAMLARDHGMELLGTEIEPDWAIWDGYFEMPGISESRASANTEGLQYLEIRWQTYLETPDKLAITPEMSALVSSTPDERERALTHVPSPNKRFHYRYLASDLMWECASLLPDNDEMTAKALYLGGLAISKRDPQGADKFFKALVRRCGKLPVGQEAREKNWFPKNFYNDDMED